MQGPIRALAIAAALVMINGCDQANQTLERRVSKQCALDVINGSQELIVQAKPQVVDFRGWAVDSESKTVPDRVNVVLTNKHGRAYVFPHATRNPRPDVVKAFKRDSYLQSGYRVLADVSSLPDDTYLISLQMPTEKSIITCSTRKTLLIKK